MDAVTKTAESEAKDAAAAEEPVDAIATVDLTTIDLEPTMSRFFPEVTARKIEGVPIGKADDNTLTLVVKDPHQVYIYDFVEIATHGRYKAVLFHGDPLLIDLGIQFIYRPAADTDGVTWKEWMERKALSQQHVQMGKDETELTGESVERVDTIIKDAIAVNASDIHLENFDTELVVRYRQDGVLHIVDRITDRDLAHALITRLKVLGHMDITNERLTQGGRISLNVAGKGYDLRVSIVPVPAGESVVMRILKKSAFTVELSDLGFDQDSLKKWSTYISRPHGVILVSGPTGSGKSTTLFASLKTLARPDRKLLTVEDPIEYEMPGIVQVQVNLSPQEEQKKVTFASALREFLRQDPDVILVGEIRDEETAHISIQAALTGHLVLSTIHTNDAIKIITRLKDLNVKGYLIASALIAATAQRLVRKLCTNCREKIAPTPAQSEVFARHQVKLSKLYHGRGCDDCHDTGYRGRIAIVETFGMTDELADLIERDATTLEMSRLAKSQGMKGLLEDGLYKAAEGMVDFDEVQRVCRMDE